MTQELVKQLFDYDPAGYLVWRDTPSKRPLKGKFVGCVGTRYRQTRVGGKNYLVHRLIYLWHQGILPKLIDHINRNKTDNRIENLRASTMSENSRNRKSLSGSSSQFLGVWWDTKRNKWKAAIRTDKGRCPKHLGRFESEEDAAIAYDVASFIYHGQFAAPSILNYEVL